MSDVNCKICGTIFEKTGNRKTCSDKCAGINGNLSRKKLAHRYVSLQTKETPCPVCGTVFMGNRRNQFCKVECRIVKYREYQKRYRVSRSFGRGCM